MGFFRKLGRAASGAARGIGRAGIGKAIRRAGIGSLIGGPLGGMANAALGGTQGRRMLGGLGRKIRSSFLDRKMQRRAAMSAAALASTGAAQGQMGPGGIIMGANGAPVPSVAAAAPVAATPVEAPVAAPVAAAPVAAAPVAPTVDPAAVAMPTDARAVPTVSPITQRNQSPFKQRFIKTSGYNSPLKQMMDPNQMQETEMNPNAMGNPNTIGNLYGGNTTAATPLMQKKKYQGMNNIKRNNSKNMKSGKSPFKQMSYNSADPYMDPNIGTSYGEDIAAQNNAYPGY